MRLWDLSTGQQRAALEGHRDGPTELEAFFAGLELVDPGVVLAHRWRPEEGAVLPKDSEITMYAGVARKN